MDEAIFRITVVGMAIVALIAAAGAIFAARHLWPRRRSWPRRAFVFTDAPAEIGALKVPAPDETPGAAAPEAVTESPEACEAQTGAPDQEVRIREPATDEISAIEEAPRDEAGAPGPETVGDPAGSAGEERPEP